MNLRNGKTTAVVAAMERMEPTKERVQEFMDELRSMFEWVAQFEDDPYGRVCAYCELFQVTLYSMDEFKDVPTLNVLMQSIRDAAIRMMGDIGGMIVKYGNGEDFMEAVNRLTHVLVALLAKYAQ
jgi:hypothetical protein